MGIHERMQDATRAIAFSVLVGCNLQRQILILSRSCEKAHRGRRVVLETLLIFLALIGSFALVGLLVRFSENVIHPADDMASADRRDKKA